MTWEKEDLEEILERDFIENPNAFRRGCTNDDMVDSKLICFSLNRSWEAMFDQWCQKNTVIADDGREYFKRDVDEDGTVQWWYPTKKREINRIEEHRDRVDAWLNYKEKYSGYVRGETDIMDYAINY